MKNLHLTEYMVVGNVFGLKNNIISIISSWYSIKFIYEKQIEHTPFEVKMKRKRSAHLDIANKTSEGRSFISSIQF